MRKEALEIAAEVREKERKSENVVASFESFQTICRT